MFSPIMHALHAGFSSSQVLKYIASKFPHLSNAIHTASAAGFTADMILRKISGKQGKGKPAEEFMTPHEQYVRNLQKTKDKNKTNVIGALGTAGAVGAGLYGISQMGKGVRPSQILPAQASRRGPQGIPGPQTRLGLPAPGQAAGAQQARAPASPMQPQAPIAPPYPLPGQQAQAPQSAPMPQPSPAKKASQVLDQVIIRGQPLGDLVKKIISVNNQNGSIQTAADVALVLEHTFLNNAQKKWLQQNSDVPLEQLIESYMQEQPEQQTQEAPQEAEEIPAETNEMAPAMPQEINRSAAIPEQMPMDTKEKSTPKVSEKIKGASFGMHHAPKLSDKKLRAESFAVPTYKFSDETPKEFESRKVINEAIEKAAKMISEDKTFLDVPGFNWGSSKKMKYSFSSEILKYIAGIPNPVHALLDDEEHRELNAALESVGISPSLSTETPTGDPDIYGAHLDKDMVWNMLLAVEPRLHTIDRPKSVKKRGNMGTTELRRMLTHAVYGVISGKRITNKLVDKIGKISSVSSSLDTLAEALKQGKINKGLQASEEIQKLSDEEFFGILDDYLEEKEKEEKEYLKAKDEAGKTPRKKAT